MKYRRALIVIFSLLLVSPVFGVILANVVNYHEPLDVAAEMLHLREMKINWTPLYDYTVPGLPETIGYIIAGLIGVGVILGIGYLLSKVVASEGTH